MAASAAVNPYEIKTLYANGSSTFFVKGNPGFGYGPKSLPRYPPDSTILDSWAFDNFTLANELFMKAFRSFKPFLSVSNNLCGKSASSLESPIIFN